MDVIVASNKGALYAVVVKTKDGDFCTTHLHMVLAETKHLAAKAGREGYREEDVISAAVYDRREDYEAHREPKYEQIGPKASIEARARGGSVYRGVTRNKSQRKPWRAKITTQDKTYTLGVYATEEEAARAYDAAAIKHFGGAARPNFPHEAA